MFGIYKLVFQNKQDNKTDGYMDNMQTALCK